MQKHHFAIVAFIILAAAGGAFYGGEAYAKSKTGGAPTFAGRAGQGGQGGANQTGAGGTRRTMMQGAGLTDGDVLKKDDTSITLKLRDGGSKIIFFSDTTAVSKTVDAKINDVAVGEHISVVGTANSDGSVTAKNIQIRPAMPEPIPTK